jgi:hypothetical protein
MSYFRSNAQFRRFIAYVNEVIRRYPPGGAFFSITDVEGVMYDSETKTLVAEWLDRNRPYITYGGMIGMDSTKRLMMNSILKLCGLDNVKSLCTRDAAVEWLAGL